MGTHMKYGGSTIALTGLCPGSNNAREACGRVEAGAAADRGTRIHQMLENLWNEKGIEGEEKEILVAQSAHKALQTLIAEHGFKHQDCQVEQQVTLHLTHKDAGGTIDAIAVRPCADMLIADLKTGFNYVAAEENLQMLFYGVGAVQGMDEFTRSSIGRCHFAILQPDTEPPYETAVRQWSCTMSELDGYATRFREIIYRAERNPGLRIAGEHCKNMYCPAITTCKAHDEWLNERSAGQFHVALTGVEQDFPKQDFPKGERLSALLKAKPFLTALLTKAEEDMKALLMEDPDAAPDWSLVDSFGNRSWDVDEKDLTKQLKDAGLKPAEFTSSKVLSVAQIEKLCKTKKIELDLSEAGSLVRRPYIGVRLVQKTGITSLFESVNNDNNVKE